MSAIYRSYEVLVEETASNHKTRGVGKTKKDFKPHFENTCRALKVTHELFQGAVCYYILCLDGLVKNECDKGEPVNRMWENLHSDSMRAATNEIAAQLGKKYFNQQNLGVNASEKLLEFIYASNPTNTKILAYEVTALKSVYLQLAGAAYQIKKQGKGENAKTKAALADMAKFASNWYQRLANPASTQGGQEIESRNNAYWLGIAAELKPTIEPELQSNFDDTTFAKRLELKYCFNSPVTNLSVEDSLKDYGSAFGVVEPNESKPFWNEPPKTVVAALKRYASPTNPNEPKVTFDIEVSSLRKCAQDKQQRANFNYPAVTSGSKPSGTYWLCLRYKFSPSPQTRRQLFENIKKRKETDAADPLAAVRAEFRLVFPFFTNLLGLAPKPGEGAVWTGFDKSAFKRAAEEVFKYRLRSDEREDQIRKRRTKIAALEGCGEWKDDKGKAKHLGGIEGDEERPRLMRQLLDKLGGAIGWHFMFSFKLEREMQKLLVDEAAAIPGEKDGSIRKVKKSGRWVGLNLRWPIDLKTESPKKKDEAAAISADGDEIEEADAKFSVKKIWCSGEFKPFDILSVDLGVRYAGAWCRGRVKIGRDAGRSTERLISPAGHGQEIVYGAYDFGTFRLQGEDAKIWRKDKHKGFADEPELEKCGSRGRIASEIERAEFAELAGYGPSIRHPNHHGGRPLFFSLLFANWRARNSMRPGFKRI